MKITAVRTVVVWGPRRPAYGGAHRTALGPATVSDYAIVFVDTDAGHHRHRRDLVGVQATRRGSCARPRAALVPAVIGEDPFRIAYLVQKMDRALDGVEEAKAGLEMACWDIVGQGARTRRSTTCSAARCAIACRSATRYRSASRTTWPSTRWSACVRAIAPIKVKVGNDVRRRDIEAVRRVREAIGPEVRLRVDGNMGWSTREAGDPADPRDGGLRSRAGRAAAAAATSSTAMAEVRRGIGVPLMADESIRDRVRRHGGDPPRRGRHRERLRHRGGRAAQRRAASSRCARRPACPCMIGSMPEFGIGTAAQIHLGVAMTNLGPDSDTCGVLYHPRIC